MRKSTRLITLFCLLLILFSSFSFCVAEDSLVQIQYVFSGEGKEKDGYGEGNITLVGHQTSGYYTLYWADDTAVLPDYEEITTLSVTQREVSFVTPEGMAIPKDATTLAVFYSTDGTPASLLLRDAVGLFSIPAEKRFAGTKEFSFASISDVHLNYTSQGASAKLTAALNYFHNKGLAYVFVSGDITNSGGTADYQAYVNAIENSAFPIERIYESRGNHDALDITNFLHYTTGAGEIRPYQNAPYFHLLLEGDAGEKDNLFIFMTQELDNISASSTEDNFSMTQLDWLEGLLSQYAGQNTNIFILQHGYFKNWGPGDRYNGAYPQPMILSSAFPGNLRYKALLEEYKECIVMSGHSHLSFREGQNFSTENGTAARMIHNSSTSQPRIYLPDGTLSYAEATAEKGSEGYAVTVFSDDILYEGTDLTTAKKIPTACFIFPSYCEDRTASNELCIQTPPQKTVYKPGEVFDPTGMVITVDGQVVKGWYCDTTTPLSLQDTAVTVWYGDVSVSQPITVRDLFAGSGTKNDPYLIQTAEDFKNFSDLFESKNISDSNDAAGSFGYGKYYLQTADIDMRGVADYKGTDAWGNGKDSFGGVYDGGGHTLQVAISSTATDVSVFPYVGGVVMNLTFSGTLTAATNAQIVRTLGKNGLFINCKSDMTLQSGGKANGFCYSSYGTVARFYNTATLSAPTLNLCAITHKEDTYLDFYHCITGAAGSAVTGSLGTRSDDIAAITTALNNVGSSAVAQMQAKLQAAGLSMEDLCVWQNGALTTTRFADHSHTNRTEFTQTHHYDVCSVCSFVAPSAAHEFTDACDTGCDGCDFTREAPHQYEDEYDPFCDNCEAERGNVLPRPTMENILSLLSKDPEVLTDGTAYALFWEMLISPNESFDFAGEDIRFTSYGLLYSNDKDKLSAYLRDGVATKAPSLSQNVQRFVYDEAPTNRALNRIYKTYSYKINGVPPAARRFGAAYIRFTYNETEYEVYSPISEAEITQ